MTIINFYFNKTRTSVLSLVFTLISRYRVYESMFKVTKAFSSFSVDDIQKAKKFYGQTLGLDVSEAYGSTRQ